MSQWQGVIVDFRVLGPVEAVEGDRVVAAGATREGLLLADLLVHVGEVVSSSRLIEDLWRGVPPPGARATLATYVRNLRNLLEPGRVSAGGLILTRRPGYLLRADPGSIDADRFEGLTAQGRRALASGDPAAAAGELRAALGLWRGPAYAEVAPEAFAQGEANRLAELRLVAMEARVGADLALGRHGELVGELEVLVADYPFRERLWAQLMVALYRAGRQAESLRAYRRLRRLLNDELGIEPTSALRDLERDILFQRQVGPPPCGDAAGGAGQRGPTSGTAVVDGSLLVGDDLGEVDSRFGVDGDGVSASPSPEDASSGRSFCVSPPPSSRRGHNLPVPLTPFVGRAAELDEVAGQLRTRRLVTLTGAGGVGKTRLAVQAALVAAEHYPDGVWMLELAALSEETMVPSALAAMLGVRQGGPDSFEAVEQLVCGYLAGRRVLLVLDNCEHVVGAVARLVHAVLTACPSLSVLATSRALLGVTGETAWTVPPLSLPAHDRADMREMLACDAVAFFCERAQAARSQFQLSPSNALAVIGICRRLDGIPLALELAAARVRMLSVNQIAERLADCFALLTGGPRTAVPRHRTLRAALDWSYDLLSAEEQTALQRLAVFPDHFDLEAAAAVLAGNGPGSAAAGIDGNGFDLLALLVEKSLVVVHPRGEEIRYRLLEPIRQYAGGKLAQAGDTDAARGHHRDFFLQRSEMFRRFSLGGLAHSHRFFVDQANYRAALEWSWQEGNLDAALSLVHAHWPAWRSTGDPRGRQWLERVLAQPEPAEHPVRPLLHAVLANQLQNSGQPDPEREEQLMREAAALARRSGDPQLIAAIDFGWAELELAWGKTAQARTLMEAALAAYERFESPANVGWCHDHLGWVAVAECDYHRAHDHFQRAAESAGLEAGDPWLAAHALAALAPLTVLVDDPERGRRLADEAIAAARNLATPSVLHMALTRAAETEIVGGDHPRAGPILAELLQLLSDVGSRWWLADALEMAALVLESQADPATAAEILGASEALRAVSGETPGGSRPVGAELAPGRDRLIAVLGADHFAHHQARGRKLTPEAAAAAALRALGAPTPMSAI